LIKKLPSLHFSNVSSDAIEFGMNFGLLIVGLIVALASKDIKVL